jgi:hypothetical protein
MPVDRGSSVHAAIGPHHNPRRNPMNAAKKTATAFAPALATALAAAMLGIAPAPALAAPFTIFIYETREDIALRADQGDAGKAYWGAYSAFGEELAKAGAIRGGAPLMVSANMRLASDGARADGVQECRGLILGGYFQIDAPDAETAERLARLAPAITRGGAVEVIAHLPTPGMAGQ